MCREHLNIVFIGHVDAGKSTTGGQILYLTVSPLAVDVSHSSARLCCLVHWSRAMCAARLKRMSPEMLHCCRAALMSGQFRNMRGEAQVSWTQQSLCQVCIHVSSSWCQECGLPLLPFAGLLQACSRPYNQRWLRYLEQEDLRYCSPGLMACMPASSSRQRMEEQARGGMP